MFKKLTSYIKDLYAFGEQFADKVTPYVVGKIGIKKQNKFVSGVVNTIAGLLCMKLTGVCAGTFMAAGSMMNVLLGGLAGFAITIPIVAVGVVATIFGAPIAAGFCAKGLRQTGILTESESSLSRAAKLQAIAKPQEPASTLADQSVAPDFNQSQARAQDKKPPAPAPSFKPPAP